MSVYLYADETEFSRPGIAPGDLTVGYGVLVCSAPVDRQVVVDALADLDADPDRHKPKHKLQDDRTLYRGYFHAVDDSKNGHSHLCTAIREHISGRFTYALVDGKAPVSLDKLYKEALELSLLEICHSASPVHLLVEQRDKLSVTSFPMHELYKKAAKSVYDFPNEPFFCPPVVARMGTKQDPPLQVVDFLLWSCGRAVSDAKDDVWLRRLDPKLRFALNRSNGPVIDGSIYLDSISVNPSPEVYLPGIIGPKLNNWPQNVGRDWKLIEDTVRDITALPSLPAEIDHLSEILKPAADGLASTKMGEAATSVQAIATAYLCIFDTLPLYRAVDSNDLPQWLDLLHARKTAALIAKAEHPTASEMMMCVKTMAIWKSAVARRKA